jgi:Spy/CpxP family protein refolding chaperone
MQHRFNEWRAGSGTMRRPIRLLLASPVLMIGAITSFAQTTPAPATAPATTVNHSASRPWHGPMWRHPFWHILRQLDLTTEQKTKVESIDGAARPQMESLAKSTRENMVQLMSTSPQDPGYAALEENAKSNALAHIKLISDTQTQIYAVLTPEQQAKIPAIVAAEKAKWEAARQKRQSRQAAPQ